MWEKNEREENDATESLYFGNDFAEIGESWGKKKLFDFGNGIAKKWERREKKLFAFSQNWWKRGERKKFISLFYLTFFNVSKIYPIVL